MIPCLKPASSPRWPSTIHHKKCATLESSARWRKALKANFCDGSRLVVFIYLFQRRHHGWGKETGEGFHVGSFENKGRDWKNKRPNRSKPQTFSVTAKLYTPETKQKKKNTNSYMKLFQSRRDWILYLSTLLTACSVFCDASEFGNIFKSSRCTNFWTCFYKLLPDKMLHKQTCFRCLFFRKCSLNRAFLSVKQ